MEQAGCKEKRAQALIIAPEFQDIYDLKAQPKKLLEINKRELEDAEKLYFQPKEKQSQGKDCGRDLVLKSMRLNFMLDIILQSSENNYLIIDLYDHVVRKLVKKIKEAYEEQNLSNQSLIQLQRYFYFLQSKYYKLTEVDELVYEGSVQDLESTFYQLVHRIIFSNQSSQNGQNIFKHLEAPCKIQDPIPESQLQTLILLITTNDHIPQLNAETNERKIQTFLINFISAIEKGILELNNSYANKSIQFQEFLAKGEIIITSVKKLLTEVFSRRISYSRQLSCTLENVITQMRDEINPNDLNTAVYEAFINQNFQTLILIKNIFSFSFKNQSEDVREFQFLCPALIRVIQSHGDLIIQKRQEQVNTLQSFKMCPKDSIVQGIMNLYHNFYIKVESIFQSDDKLKHWAIRDYLMRGFSQLYDQKLSYQNGNQIIEMTISQILGNQLDCFSQEEVSVIFYLLNWQKLSQKFLVSYKETLIYKVLDNKIDLDNEIERVRSFCQVQQIYQHFETLLQDCRAVTLQKSVPYSKFISQLEEEQKLRIEPVFLRSQPWTIIEYEYDIITSRPFCSTQIINYFKSQDINLQISDAYSMVEVQFRGRKSRYTLKMQLAQYEILRKVESLCSCSCQELVKLLNLSKEFVAFSLAQGVEIGLVEEICSDSPTSQFSINQQFESKRKFYKFQPKFDIRIPAKSSILGSSKPDNTIIEAKIMRLIKSQKDRKIEHKPLRDYFEDKTPAFEISFKQAIERLIRSNYLKGEFNQSYQYN